MRMKALKIIVAIVLVVLFGYGMAAWLSPDRIVVSGSMKMYAAPPSVFKQVVCLDKWANWDAWGELDPMLEMECSDRPCGTSAWCRWKSHAYGSCMRSVSELITDSLVTVQLQYEHFPELDQVEWVLVSDGPACVATCTLTGNEVPFFKRPFSLLMKEMLQEYVNNSLLNLKKTAERNPSDRLRLYEYRFDVVCDSIGPIQLATVQRRIQHSEFPLFLEEALSLLASTNANADSIILVIDEKTRADALASVAMPVRSAFNGRNGVTYRVIPKAAGCMITGLKPGEESQASSAIARYFRDTGMQQDSTFMYLLEVDTSASPYGWWISSIIYFH